MSEDLEEQILRLRRLLEDRGYKLVGDYRKEELTEGTRRHSTSESFTVCISRASANIELYDASMGDSVIVLLFRIYGGYEPLDPMAEFSGTLSYSTTAELPFTVKTISSRSASFSSQFDTFGYVGVLFGSDELGEISLHPPMIVYTRGGAVRGSFSISVESRVIGTEGSLYKCYSGFEITRVLVFARQPMIQIYEILNTVMVVYVLMMMMMNTFISIKE